MPFPVESALSGVMKTVGDDEPALVSPHVRRAARRGATGRTLLHFGASTGKRRCSSTARSVGTHRGGYDPFTFDITDALKASRHAGTASSAVWDPTDSRHAAARQAGRTGRAASGTRRSPASGRPCGSSRCPTRAIDGLDARARHRRRRADVSTAIATRRATASATVTAVALDGAREVAAAARPDPASRSRCSIPNAEALVAGLAVPLRPEGRRSRAATARPSTT